MVAPTQAGAVGASPASAIKHADSTGPVVVDSSGNGYLSWNSSKNNANGDPVDFCKIPRGGTCTKPMVLPHPAGITWDDYDVTQPFPVIGGKAGVVSVVAPSYLYSNVVVWTSHDRGKSFGQPVVVAPDYHGQDDSAYNGTNTDDVLRSPDAAPPYYPDYFSIGSDNPGLFYSFTGIGANEAPDPPAGFPFNTSKVAGSVDSATIGYGKTYDPGQPSQSTQTVEAFSTDADNPQLDYFWAPLPGVSSPGDLETGPIKVGLGINPRLAGGPRGLYLLSEDYVGSPSNSSKPLHLDVRRWNPKTKSFGQPTLVTTVPNDINASNEGGFTEDATTGRLTVAWPKETASGSYVMDVWSAKPGHAFGKPSRVATIPGGYGGPARLAMTGGHGFLTWGDYGGLELVDLKS
jgi:hypothetical protein